MHVYFLVLTVIALKFFLKFGEFSCITDRNTEVTSLVSYCSYSLTLLVEVSPGYQACNYCVSVSYARKFTKLKKRFQTKGNNTRYLQLAKFPLSMFIRKIKSLSFLVHSKFSLRLLCRSLPKSLMFFIYSILRPHNVMFGWLQLPWLARITQIHSHFLGLLFLWKSFQRGEYGVQLRVWYWRIDSLWALLSKTIAKVGNDEGSHFPYKNNF